MIIKKISVDGLLGFSMIMEEFIILHMEGVEPGLSSRLFMEYMNNQDKYILFIFMEKDTAIGCAEYKYEYDIVTNQKKIVCAAWYINKKHRGNKKFIKLAFTETEKELVKRGEVMYYFHSSKVDKLRQRGSKLVNLTFSKCISNAFLATPLETVDV